MKNILVYCNHKKLHNNWGYEWKGFSNGKRFHVIADPSMTDTLFDKEKYYITTHEQIKLLPSEIKKLVKSCRPLPNTYFLLGKWLDTSVEIVMQLIEKGYDLSNIEKYPSYQTENTINKYKENYLCKYFYKDTRKTIVEILKDGSVKWND